MTLGELIEALGGEIVAGSPEIVIADVTEVAAARGLDLVFAENAENAREALQCNASAVVLKPGLADSATEAGHIGIVVAEQPRLWFAKAAKLLAAAQPIAGVHHLAILGAQVEIGSGATIAAGAIVGDQVKIGGGTRVEAGAVIGAGVAVGYHCKIYPRVVIYPGTTVGDRVVIHAGAVLGADGFGYVRDSTTGAYTQFPQEGTLVIEDDVEIGANSTIDRGALAETRIRRGTKIDNLVHVGHNCDIGEDVILVALTGISGSSTVGNGAVLAGQVGIGDHAHVGPGVILGGQAGVFSGKTVTNDGLPPGSVLWGTPARPLKQVLREQAVLKRLAGRKRGAETGDWE